MIRMKRSLLFGSLGLAITLLLAACGGMQGGASSPAVAEAPTAAASGDHSAAGHGTMQADPAVPYDAQFIDSMIVHHQGAVVMAQQALREAERPELKQLAETVISDQEAEIAQMQQWRQAWYPALAPSTGLGMEMGTMAVADDPSKPFDQRFIEAMIPHHEGAIAMAKDAQQKAARAEIRDLAARIITAQEAEIAQMRKWQQAWFGE